MTPDPIQLDIASFAKILDLWPSIPVLAQELRLPVSTVHAWRRRDSIPPGYWPDLTANACTHGIAGVYPALFERVAAVRLKAWRERQEVRRRQAFPLVKTKHAVVVQAVSGAQVAHLSTKRKQQSTTTRG